MLRRASRALILTGLWMTAAGAQAPVPAVPDAPATSAASTAGAALTPAERHVARARQALLREPRSARVRADLALALARRARETSNTDYYVQAQHVLDEALTEAPGDYDALKARAWVLLGQHEFARSLELARSLNARAPDDLTVYGYIADASAELGRYDEAERAAQWMLDLRPGNVPGLTRAAYLRELFGDLEGALELMAQALDRTAPSEVEDRAWVLTQIGHLHLLAGRVDDAQAALEHALALFPDYHYALAQLARVRGAQGRHAEAVQLLRQRYLQAAHAENLYDLAEALRRAGQKAEARRAYLEFERLARAELAGADNANRELIAYYAGPGRRPTEALRLARAEIAVRQDVGTRAAYARALQVNGRQREAREQLDAVLAVGVKDPALRAQAEALRTRGRARRGRAMR